MKEPDPQFHHKTIVHLIYEGMNWFNVLAINDNFH